jgi:hypothetical protein
MPKIKLFRTAFLFSFFALILFACRKTDSENDNDLTASRDNAMLQNAFAGIIKSAFEYADSSSLLRNSCAMVSVDSFGTASWPKRLIIDFGTTSCRATDGSSRSGKITAVFSNRLSDSLTSVLITLNNYKHENNGIGVSSLSIVNKGRNLRGNTEFSVNLQNASITTNEGTANWNATHQLERIAGKNTTGNPMDDVYAITGNSNGTAINGNTFTAIIMNALQINMNCAWITNGAISLSPANLITRTIDFGNGMCDNIATVKIKGNTNEISF